MIVVDAEMSGLDATTHSIVSIGAVDMSEPIRRFYGECRIWDGATIDPAALAVNGFTVEQVTDPSKPSLKELMSDFISWVKPSPDQTIAGQNVSYDSAFLVSSVKRFGLDWRTGHRTIDLHSVCWAQMTLRGTPVPMKNERTNLNLDAILQYAGLPAEPRPHNGLVGALMEAEAFSRLLYGRSLLAEYAQYPIPEYLID